MAVATGAKSFRMIGLEQRLPNCQVGAPYVVRAMKATGAITCIAKADFVDGETLTIGDGTHSVVFEFDVAGNGVTPGRTAVDISGATTAASVAVILDAAINGITTGLTVTSTDNLDGTLSLENDATGALGNVVITETVANAGFLVSGMSGGVDENFGLCQLMARPGGGVTRTAEWADNDEFTGSLEPAEKSLVGWSYKVDSPQWLRTAPLVMELASMLGEPSVTQDGASSAWQYTFPLTDDPAAAISLWELTHKAGSTYPVLARGIRYNSIEIDAPERGESAMKASGLGCGWTECGIGVQATANSGTNPCGAYLTGPRTDTNKYTDALKFKVSRTVGGGGFRVKVALGIGAYATTEIDVTTSGTTGFQTAWAEVIDDSGPLGLDDCEDGLEPLLVFFSGDLRLYAVDDIIEHPALVQIPGDGSGETGLARVALDGPRFGPAHVTFKYGTSTADTELAFEIGSLKLTRTIEPVLAKGRNARNPSDLDVVGYLGVEAELTRRFDSRTWERFMSLGTRPVAEFKFEGCTIAASASGWKESLTVSIPQFRIDDAQSPVANAGSVKETIKGALEKSRAGTASSVIVRSGTFIDFSKA